MRARESLAGRLRGNGWQVIDGVIALGVTATEFVAGSQYHVEGWPQLDRTGYVLSAAISLPLAVRRRAPVTVFVLSSAVFVRYLATGYPASITVWGPAIALYTVAVHRPPRTTAVVAAATIAVLFYSGHSARGALSDLLSAMEAIAFVAIIWTFGNIGRTLGKRNEQLAALTVQLHTEQEDNARRAVTDERVRIARELHDVVAHHMAVISVQAGLAQYVFTADPDTARGAVETIAVTSREAQEEMRRLLSVLRVGQETADGSGRLLEPAPGLDQLTVLADRIAVAGVPVELAVTGTPRPLPPGLNLCAYRVIQESLTNALKHAGFARTTVELGYRADRLTVRIGNELPAPIRPTASTTSGHGLMGMRERATVYGGTLTAGVRPDGAGFDVVLTLPLPSHPGTDDVRATTG